MEKQAQLSMGRPRRVKEWNQPNQVKVQHCQKPKLSLMIVWRIFSKASP